MSEAEVGDVKQKEEDGDDSSKNEVDCEISVDDRNADNPMPSSEEEEQAIKKKYGGMLPKKPPLISKVANHFLSDLASPMLLFLLPSDHLCVCLKCSFETPFSSWPIFILQDHERAYFDSADWALGKQGAQKPKGPLEALRPKLQPTQQHARSRRSAYAPADDSEGEGGHSNTSAEEESATEDVGGDAPQEQSHR
ncbi:uncharacterized protein LOC108335162 isoform X1 [Vigna angularis]|uniref:uncharacterized protein LOC108335162 isoform X1 n=1 Tax=Phaseolus angularis TaxID=3914 RepID=UPI0022B47587|nr:uncharacterized protein LOC108335162 isoform X1 [Vigna angularis]